VGTVEIALALAHRWRESVSRQISIVAPERLLSGQPSRVRSLVMRACRREGVVVLEHKAVGHIDPTRLRLTNGEVIDTQLTVLATGYAAAPLLEKTDLATADDGSVLVNRYLQSSNQPHIFAAGDCAEIVGTALPKSGRWAERQGVLLAANLHAYMRGKPLQPFVYNRRGMNVISLGERRAVVSRFGVAVSGRWVWRWKDSLDRKWIQRYSLD
jgi:selenide, water dikinase